jgi:uncharacterized protein involved in exopolysaccharide biosynthesis
MFDYRGGANNVSDATPAPRVASEDSGLTIKDAWRLAWRRKGLIIALAMLGALAGLVATKTLTPRYVATAQIYLDPHGLPGLDKEDSASHEDSTGFINFVETQAKILTSRVVLERVVTKERLAADPEFGGAHGGFLNSLLGRAPSSTGDADGALNAERTLAQRIVIRRPERTFIIEISATSSSPEKAARIANSVAQAYNDVRLTMQSEAARQATNSFSASLGEMRDRLLVAEKQVEDYKATNGLVGTRDQYVDEQSLKELNQQLSYARARLEDARSRFEQLKRARASSADLAMLTATLNIPTLTNLRGQQTAALEKIAELSAELGPIHPTVKNAEARVNELRRLIDIELERIRASSRKDLEQARNVEEGLRRDVEQLRQRALVAAQASVKLRDLEREVEVNRSVYQSFFARSRQTEEAQPSNLMSTHIVTMASPPPTRSFPPGAGLMMAAGFLLGSLLGGAWGLALEIRNNAGETMQASTPAAARADEIVRQAKEFLITDATPFAIRPTLHSHSSIELARLGVPVASRPGDRIEVDAITSHLLSLIDDCDEPQVIAFVGETKNEARTIMAINIALALSAAGLDVALVDGDAKDAILTSFVDIDADASNDSRDFILQTREEVSLVLPNLGVNDTSGSSGNRIIRRLLRGAMGRVDAILCDGAFDDSNALEQINWVIPVLDAEADERAAMNLLPDALADRIALIVRFKHANPWAGQNSKLSRTA